MERHQLKVIFSIRRGGLQHIRLDVSGSAETRSSAVGAPLVYLISLSYPKGLDAHRDGPATVYGGTCAVFKSMVEIGFLDIIRGSAALTQMLSSAAWHMKNENPQTPNGSADYARYSVMATSSLRRRLHEPDQRASIETIIAILAFAAYAVSYAYIYNPRYLPTNCPRISPVTRG